MFDPYEELSGSPIESFSESGGASAERHFLVPSEDRLALADQLVGGLYPHFPHCRIHSFRLQNFGANQVAPNGTIALNPISSTNDYSGKQSLLTVGYGPDFTQKEWPFPKPSFRDGTELRFQIDGGAEFLSLPSSGLQWDAGDDGGGGGTGGSVPRPEDRPPVTEDVNNFLLVNRDSVRLQWDFVDEFDANVFERLKGKVNQDAFLGAEAETMLFSSYSIHERFKAAPSNSHTNRITVNFLRRKIEDDAGIFGWNHEFRPEPAGWVRALLANGKPRYEPRPFAGMFM